MIAKPNVDRDLLESGSAAVDLGLRPYVQLYPGSSSHMHDLKHSGLSGRVSGFVCV